MADNKKVHEEDLKKLEEEAYFELCQIIAEAMQYQDVELLNSRISEWKNKYKKLLSDSPSNSNFKKRIEFLLTQYYSAVTKYILEQLNLKEQKMVENQAKAIRELYAIIQNTNDYDLLKKKVNKWKEKYPVSGFLRMYQKRIELYTRDKNIRDNAFKQEEAFCDLVDITKIHGTIDELKTELSLWEEKYSINDKYSLDDFLKHQTEVKRYTSDEFLQSIAREDFKCNSIEKPSQDKSYSKLIKLIKTSNNVDEMFKWVYENRNAQFDDKYKELILTNPHIILQYSPTYLRKFKKPIIDLSKNSLSFAEYKNISKIKEYAIISYFNLLLPAGQSISNTNFYKNIYTIYTKTQKAQSSKIEDDTLIDKSPEKDNSKIDFHVENDNIEEIEPIIDTTIDLSYSSDNTDINKILINIEPTAKEDLKAKETINLESIDTTSLPNTEPQDLKISISEEDTKDTNPSEKFETPLIIDDVDKKEIHIDLSNIESGITIDLNNASNNKDDDIIDSQTQSIEADVSNNEPIKDEKAPETLNHETIVAVSPLFIEAIDNYAKQSVLVNYVDATTTKHIESQKDQTISIDKTIKIKNDEN